MNSVGDHVSDGVGDRVSDSDHVSVNVSIIIPVYNVQEYLAACLDSVTGQTIKSKEIIIVNDGSTDKCKEILSKYKKEFPELIIINQKNSGISETRNVGLRAAKGEYIAFVDLRVSERFVILPLRISSDFSETSIRK